MIIVIVVLSFSVVYRVVAIVMVVGLGLLRFF